MAKKWITTRISIVCDHETKSRHDNTLRKKSFQKKWFGFQKKLHAIATK